MPTIQTNLKKTVDGSYKIFIEKGIIEKLPEYLDVFSLGQKYAIITDSGTKKIHGEKLLKIFKKTGISATIFSFKAGEKSKSLKTLEHLAEKMIAKNFTRKDVVIALGGGVVGDIAAFLASVFLRGIPCIQIPTTLLAMVDSAIGGKNGVDMNCGKNLLGTIVQPKAVFIDINFLKTLPENQIRNGLGEIIKYGVIKDPELFKFIEQNLKKIFSLDEKTINYIIEKSVSIKVKVVENDELECKDRMILNYGHTYGHALEKLSNYKLLHGYAISIGMVMANEMAIKKGLLSKHDAERIKKLFIKVGLPVHTMKKPTIKDLLSDKKRTGDFINFVLPKKIGEMVIYKEKIKF